MVCPVLTAAEVFLARPVLRASVARVGEPECRACQVFLVHLEHPAMTASSALPDSQARSALKVTPELTGPLVSLAKPGKMDTMVPLVRLDAGDCLVSLDLRVLKGQRGHLVLTASFVALLALPAPLLSVPLQRRPPRTLHPQNQRLHHPLPRNHLLLHPRIQPQRHRALRVPQHLRNPQNEALQSFGFKAA